jgi:hypothetical protein
MIGIRQISLAAAVVAASFAVTSPAHAGGFVQQFISAVQINTTTGGTTYALVQFNVASSSPAPCSPFPFSQSMAIDISTNKGRGILSIAMAAFLAGKKVNVVGNNTTCINNFEVIQSFTVTP